MIIVDIIKKRSADENISEISKNSKTKNSGKFHKFIENLIKA